MKVLIECENTGSAADCLYRRSSSSLTKCTRELSFRGHILLMITNALFPLIHTTAVSKKTVASITCDDDILILLIFYVTSSSDFHLTVFRLGTSLTGERDRNYSYSCENL